MEPVKTQSSPDNLSEEAFLYRIVNNIRKSLSLSEILATAIAEIQTLMQSDRVMVYQFAPNGSGLVTAEVVNSEKLPSLKGLRFLADAIPLSGREMYLKSPRSSSVVNLTTGSSRFSVLPEAIVAGVATIAPKSPAELSPELEYLSLEPCSTDYLLARGVTISITLPLILESAMSPTEDQGTEITEIAEPRKTLWGLVVCHSCDAQSINMHNLPLLQAVVEQLAIAITQANLLAQSHLQTAQERLLNKIAILLRSQSSQYLSTALETIVTSAFQGIGGRIYLAPPKTTSQGTNSILNLEGSRAMASDEGNQANLYCWGEQPQDQSLEMRRTWQQLFREPHEIVTINNVWATAIGDSFGSTAIRGLISIPLFYENNFLGYLSIFREEIGIETLWAGQVDADPISLDSLDTPRTLTSRREISQGTCEEWTRDHHKLLRSIADQVATAIVQDRLYQKVQTLNNTLEAQARDRTADLAKALETQSALNHITKQIRKTLDLSTILQTVVTSVRELLGSDRAFVYRLLPENSGKVVIEDVLKPWLPIMGDYKPQIWLQENDKLDWQNMIQVINSLEEVDLQPEYREFLQQYQVQSRLAVPIGDKELWGFLIVHHCREPRVWQPQEIECLQRLAGQARIAIAQAELYAQAQEKNEQQKTLSLVVSKIRESLHIDTIFQATTTEVRRLLAADRVGIFRFDPDSGFDRGLFVSEDVQPGFISAIEHQIKDHYFGSQFTVDYAHGRIQAVADIYHQGLSAGHVEVLAKFQIRANLIIPIRYHPDLKALTPTLWGLLCIHQCQAPRQWQQDEIEFVQQIADQLGVALQQAELLARTQQQAADLAQTLEELKQTQSQLIQTEKMSSLGQLVAGVAHEINNPVNFIHGNLAYTSQYTKELLELVYLYQECYPQPQTKIQLKIEDMELDFVKQDMPRVMESMKVGADRIRQIVASLRNFSRLDHSDRKAVDIHEGIDSTLLILQHRFKATPTGLNIQVIKNYADLPLITCYVGQLNQVFMNLISNAIDAFETDSSGTNPTITISTYLMPNAPSQPEKVAIEIADNGSGIPPEVQARIFDPFFTTKPVGKGTGLGLSISHQIVVEKHNGTIECISDIGKGTKFLMQIPR